MKTLLLSMLAVCALINPVPGTRGEMPPAKAGLRESIIIIGEVRSPMIIAYSKEATLVGVIEMAGGVDDYGGSSIYLIRNGASTLQPALRKMHKDPSLDVALKPWDIVCVGNIHAHQPYQK